jgi:hypothetical protein
MLVDLLIVSVVMNVLIVLFGHFEVYTPKWRRVVKVAVLLGGTAGFSTLVGHWSLLFFAAVMGGGASYHTWWCLKNDIHPLTAEPRDHYELLIKARRAQN